jgi:hypothetical protein
LESLVDKDESNNVFNNSLPFRGRSPVSKRAERRPISNPQNGSFLLLMAIVRIKKRSNPYVMIDKRPLENRDLSFKAKGLLTYLLSRPDNWEIRLEDLIQRSTDGKAAVQNALKELEKEGYAYLAIVRTDDNSQIAGKRWTIYEDPVDQTHTNGNGNGSCHRENLFNRKSATTNKDTSHATQGCGGRKKGFFEEGIEYNPTLDRLCTEFHEWVCKTFRVDRQIQRPRWHYHMRMLLRDIKDDKKRLEGILYDYMDAIEKEEDRYLPVIDTAKDFRFKFFRIEERLQKTGMAAREPKITRVIRNSREC